MSYKPGPLHASYHMTQFSQVLSGEAAVDQQGGTIGFYYAAHVPGLITKLIETISQHIKQQRNMKLISLAISSLSSSAL